MADYPENNCGAARLVRYGDLYRDHFGRMRLAHGSIDCTRVTTPSLKLDLARMAKNRLRLQAADNAV